MNAKGRLLIVAFFYAYFAGTCRGLTVGDLVERILGGMTANIRDHPYQLSLEQRAGNGYSHICGAVVISEFWALSAAHCIDTWPSNLRLRAGTSTKETGGTTHPLQSITIHPNHNKITWDYDIAILKVSQPFQYSEVLQPAYMATTTPPAGKSAILTGFGAVSPTDTMVNTLHKVTLTVTSLEDCQNYWKNIIPTPRMLCTQSLLQPTGAGGFRDSGGPLVTDQNQLVGIAFFSDWSSHNIFTDVTYLRNWISSVTGVV